jgi:NADH-quinone oxidoreductase subunit C/D
MTRQNILNQLQEKYGADQVIEQSTSDEVPTAWVGKEKLYDCMKFLKSGIERPYKMLYDLTAIDERTRTSRLAQPQSDFTIVYHLFSFERNEYLRIKTALKGESPSIPSITSIWACANWYEREIWDMFGVKVEGHPNLQRILMPPWWEGHPLRKEHPARATEMDTFALLRENEIERDNQLQFDPKALCMKQHSGDTDYMFLNIGPQHPGTHGLLRIILQLDDEEILDAAIDIGYHHRGAEKNGRTSNLAYIYSLYRPYRLSRRGNE